MFSIKFLFKHLLLSVYLITTFSSGILCAQTVPSAENLWKEQVPWEGVPDYFQNWDYPDFQFPKELGLWEKERVQVRATLKELLGDIPERPQDLTVQTIIKEERNG